MKKSTTKRKRAGVRVSSTRPRAGSTAAISRKSRAATVPPEVRHYGGNGSHWFWNRVWALKDKAAHRELYSCGVLLQNLEGSVMRWLENAEEVAAPDHETGTP
jgi:hypothetical protein